MAEPVPDGSSRLAESLDLLGLRLSVDEHDEEAPSEKRGRHGYRVKA